MATNSSVNLKITNNSDGYDIAGGTTARKLTVTGADITMTGTGTNVYTFPASTCTLCDNTLSNLGTTAITAALNQTLAVAGAGLNMDITATTYTTLVGGVDINRSGAITGVNTETMVDLYIHPTLTFTEPGSGTVNYYGASIDMSGLAVTAGAGTSVVSALHLKADDDTDTGTNYALYVESGKSNLAGYTAICMGSAPVSGVCLLAGSNGTTMPAATTAFRHLQTGGNVTELAGATITDIVGAYFNTFTITDGGGAETVGIVSTVYIADAPTAGSTPSSGPYAIFVDSGTARFDGDFNLPNAIDFDLIDNNASAISFDTSGAAGILEIITTNGVEAVKHTSRILGTQGSDVASANDITLGIGNYYDITGTTEVQRILGTGWVAGSMVVLQFDGSVTVKHGTAAGSSYYGFQLAGAGDFSATAGDTLSVVFDGAWWREIARTVI